MAGKVVVGVDGSKHGQRALRAAAQEAEQRGATLTAVTVWPPVLADPTMLEVGEPPTTDHTEDLQKQFERVLDDALATADVSVPVEKVVGPGSAAGVLVEQAEDAELLVVGTRGLGGFRGLVMGSVSHQVMGHTTCPVLVVP